MRTAPLTRQDGFIREVVWLAVIVAVVAVVLLDAMALFNAHQSSHDNASSAAREAQTEYAQIAERGAGQAGGRAVPGQEWRRRW